jgi:hypothetical protein
LVAQRSGHWLEYNKPAAKDAEKKTRVFLDAHLVGTSPGRLADGEVIQ